MTTIQLTPASNYDVSNLVFSEPREQEIKSNKDDKKSGMKYQRINISTRYPDGREGDLIFPTGELFSFGVQENTDQNTGKVNGHTMSLCLWSRDRETKKYKPTKEQLEWTNTFSKVVEAIKNKVVDFQQENRLNTFSKNKYSSLEFKVMLKKFNPLYWGKDVDDNEPDDDGMYNFGPTLYAKIIESRSKEDNSMKIITQFYDDNDQEIPDPLTYLAKRYSTLEAAIKIESVFIGGKVSLQVKLYEAANCKLIQSNMTRLLARPKPSNSLLMNDNNAFSSAPTAPNNMSDSDESDDDGSLMDDDDMEDKPAPPPPTPKKPTKPAVRKIVRRAAS